MRHGNISVFVPHIGCPNQCSFCNQNTITGEKISPTKDDVIEAVETAAAHPSYNPKNTELAFFGGSFTAIDDNTMGVKTVYAVILTLIGEVDLLSTGKPNDCTLVVGAGYIVGSR